MTEQDNELRAVATELLRLYDWRKELAKEEEDLQNTPIEQIDVREVAMREASDFEASPLIQRRAALDKKLRQYGREKKAAWERLRALLARPVDEPQQCPVCGCNYYYALPSGQITGCQHPWHFSPHPAIVPSAETPTKPNSIKETILKSFSAKTALEAVRDERTDWSTGVRAADLSDWDDADLVESLVQAFEDRDRQLAKYEAEELGRSHEGGSVNRNE